ncbi:MAG: hypothetical protein PUP92_05480 [Rhizonema sp. PD38]|nr:hypothetical protein [Rhizonema sp. PD38]
MARLDARWCPNEVSRHRPPPALCAETSQYRDRGRRRRTGLSQRSRRLTPAVRRVRGQGTMDSRQNDRHVYQPADADS